MSIYTIYKAVNTINGKVYIGFDSNWPRRKRQHKNSFKKLKTKFYSSIKKYGWDNFSWQIIYQSKDGEYCLNNMETFFIKEYDSLNNGYNMTLGGEGFLGKIPWNKGCKGLYKHTEETKLKISKNSMNRVVGDNERLLKSIRFTGSRNPMFGKKLSIEHKNKLTEKSYLPKTKEHRQKISEGSKNRIKLTCIHCGINSAINVATRWHFDNCKFKQTNTEQV